MANVTEVNNRPVKGTDNVGSEAAWQDAMNQARTVGIRWDRPDGDNRSAKEIIEQSPLLRNLGNQGGIRDMLEKRVGDIDSNADAAYRAVQVLDHIERFDAKGNRIVGGDLGDGRINGFNKKGSPKGGSEAERLMKFGKNGFSNLKGELQHVSFAGDNKDARAQAESAGIRWELPSDDKRSAQDIIDQSPLLKDLGNQSHVKDMLKERVGDFEKDANAAYRASQVLDRITMYNGKGETQFGGDASNTRIDGFTKSGEARHNTEAGRLQDFGKIGFKSLPGAKKTEDIGSLKTFLDKNKNADEISKTFAKYAALLGENFDAIRGKLKSGDYLTADDLKKYLNQNPQIGGDLKEALNFWSQPGAFGQIDSAQDPLKFKPDGKVGKKDIDGWLANQAPKDTASAMAFLTGVSNGNVVRGTDTGKLNKDLFEHPEKYSKEEKAAALMELLQARQLVVQGAEAGLWADDYGRVSISNRSDTHPDPKELLKDLNAHIDRLEGDQEVVKYLNESGSKQMAELLDKNKSLKTAVENTYVNEFKSGNALDKLWDAKTKDGKTDQQAVLAEFFGSMKTFQQVLGIDKLGEIQSAVAGSKHNGALQEFYEKSLVTGERFKELLKNNPFEKAISAFSAEVALYTSALDPKFTEKHDAKLEENFNNISRENVLKDAKFSDLERAFGKDGGSEFDAAKVKSIVDQILKENPDLFVNANGTVANADQIVSGLRSIWDIGRQGTKSVAELADAKWLSAQSKEGTFADAKYLSDRGVLHGISGVLMAGVVISKGIQSGGKPTERQLVDIVTGSVQTAGLLTEGGVKRYKQYLTQAGEAGGKIGKMSEENFKRLKDNWSKGENAAKGFGGLAGAVAGAYGIFDGVQSIRKGDVASGGISITSASVGLISGLASAAEGGVGAFGSTAVRAIMSPLAGIAGVAGLFAAGVGTIAMLLPGMIKEGQQQAKADSFGSLLGSLLKKYEIDGVPNGRVSDLPSSVWPEDRSVAS